MSLNVLSVTYDDDGSPRFWRDGEEISESLWKQQHPHFKKGNSSGRTQFGNQDDGQQQRSGGDEGGTVAGSYAPPEVRERIRAKAKAQRSRGSGDELGQPISGSE